MMQRRDIIIFGDDWGRYPSTIQHVARVLMASNRLFWIGSLGLRQPQLTSGDIMRGWNKVKNMISGPRHAPHVQTDTPVMLHPFVVPMHDNRWVHRMNISSIIKSIRTAARSYNMTRPLILSSSPLIADLIGRVDDSSAHYFCLDDYTLFDGAFRSLRRHEDDLMQKADSCYFVSDLLLKKHGLKNRESHFLPQGVDVEHFSRSVTDAAPEIGTLHAPIVGFFGLLANWIDLELIVRCAQTYRDVTFVIIGKAAVDVAKLKHCPNILYLGEIPYDQLPRYVVRFDVGMIPFRVNELTVAANPLKLLEYMAAGAAVVSTRLPEVEKFAPLVSVAGNNDEFVRMIGTSMQSDSTEKRELRRKKAQEHSWQNITEQICSTIQRVELTPRLNTGAGSVA
jgi:glycosyltransferase involved in cell wall biosynthesis